MLLLLMMIAILVCSDIDFLAEAEEILTRHEPTDAVAAQ
jgi:hypothetical protein